MKLFFSRTNKLILISMFILQLASIISTVYLAKIIGNFTDLITRNSISESINLLIIAVAIIFFHYLLMIFVFYIESKITLGIKWFLLSTKIKTSKTFDEAINEVNIHVDGYILSIIDLFWSFIILIVSSIFIAISSMATVFVVILLIILAMVSTLIFSKKIKEFKKYNLKNESKYNYEIFMAEQNIDTISLTMQEVIKASESFSLNKRKFSSKLRIFKNLKNAISSLFLGGITIAATLSLAFSIYYGTSSVGSVITIIAILSNSTIYINEIGFNMSNIKNNRWIKEEKDVPQYNFQKMTIGNNLIKKIEAKNITKIFKNKLILNKFSWTFKYGNSYLIKGANGSGKTTLVKILVGLDHEYDGKIVIDKKNKKMNYLSDSVYYQTSSTKLIKSKIKEIANSRKSIDILEKIDRIDLLEKKSSQLSSGEVEIVKILLMINSGASIKAYDELFSNLDYKTKKILLNIVLKEKGINLIISHNIDLNKSFKDEIVLRN